MLDERRPAAGDALPALEEVDGIVTFGGSQSVLDLERDAALRAERGLLRDAVAAGVPVLGICLGAQLLAHALGAPVRRAPRRNVTWMELTALPAAAEDPLFAGLGSPIRGLQWNEDVFALPPGATELLTGAPAGVAAFRAGRVCLGRPVPSRGRRRDSSTAGTPITAHGWAKPGYRNGTHVPPTTSTSRRSPSSPSGCSERSRAWSRPIR